MFAFLKCGNSMRHFKQNPKEVYADMSAASEKYLISVRWLGRDLQPVMKFQDMTECDFGCGSSSQIVCK